jgi:integrase
VTIALETGLRRAEILGLTWDRVDLSRGVIRLEITKSGKRREVPMRQVVYDTLIALPGEREGRVFRTRSIRCRHHDDPPLRPPLPSPPPHRHAQDRAPVSTRFSTRAWPSVSCL